jgi:hypothetical protein
MSLGGITVGPGWTIGAGWTLDQPGGGPPPGPVTYTENVDYGTGALKLRIAGGNSLTATIGYWIDPGAITSLISQPVGSQYTFDRSGTPYTFTTDSVWVSAAGEAVVTGSLSGTVPGSFPYNVPAITFTPV